MTEQPTGNRRRTEHVDVTFENGMAAGWVFGVPEVFRDAMDIRTVPYVDREKSRALRLASGGNHDKHGNLIVVHRTALTRGDPPARSFKEGDIFYEPHDVREMTWSEALQRLRRIVQVRAATSDDERGANGWVEMEVAVYESGRIVSQKQVRLSQSEFELLLKDG